MRLLVTGGTGFIGGPLCQRLSRQGHEVLVVTRSPQYHAAKAGLRYLAWESSEWQRALVDVEGLINLAGEPIAARRWSGDQKQRIQSSRIETTRRLIESMAGLAKRPQVLVNASAIGYYGSCGDEELTETSPPGEGFLARTCQAWEAEALRGEALGLRVVRLRLGLVLGPGGALAKMVPPFRVFLGGPLGHGRQWVSWIHRDDVIGLIEWALAHPAVAGPVNATAPHPVTMRALCQVVGQVLHRPSWAPVLAPILRLLLGEMADLLLEGQRVLPHVALEQGYQFQYPELLPAVAEVCRRMARPHVRS